MRRLPLFAAVALLALGSARAEDKKDDGFQPLFNGKDLAGLKFFIDPKVKDADPKQTWMVVDGYLRCTGKPSGFFYTDKSYKNYVLHYDWRYPKDSKPESNSGCLVHMQEPFKIWPKSLEPQGRYKDHGKIFPIGIKAENNKFDQAALDKVLKPMGEWSTTEVTAAADGSIHVKVNGAEVSSAKSDLTEGPIGWQSEGYEIHFKNIKLKPMK